VDNTFKLYHPNGCPSPRILWQTKLQHLVRRILREGEHVHWDVLPQVLATFWVSVGKVQMCQRGVWRNLCLGISKQSRSEWKKRGLQEDEGMVLENVLVVGWWTKRRTMKTLCPIRTRFKTVLRALRSCSVVRCQ
jgi:hypothetical protein